MQFTQGQIVVYPHHGPATVTAITDREVKGVTARYLVLSVHNSALTVSAPIENAELIGIRDVLDQDGLNELFELLRAPTEDEEVKWSRRFKNNAEKLKTGDMHAFARVVRDLMRRQEAKGLSLAEKDMLRYAKGPVVTEIALSMGVDTERADEVLDSLMLGTPLEARDQVAA
jgi:CarD family transcriptional regulator